MRVGKAQIPQQVFDNPSHGGKIIHDKNLHVFIQGNLPSLCRQ
jgi:hypothetical protein